MEDCSRRAPGDEDHDDDDENDDDDYVGDGDDDQEGDVGSLHLNIACSISTAIDPVENLNPLNSDFSAVVDGNPGCGLPIGVANLTHTVDQSSIEALCDSVDALGCFKVLKC